MKLAAYLSGIGVLGPGLADWPHTQDVLSGRVAYSPAPRFCPRRRNCLRPNGGAPDGS